jgi:hypothetical protein
MSKQTIGLTLTLALLLGAPAVTHAQVYVQVAVPTIRFEVRPTLVTVSEGVEVVPDYPEEVFYRDGWYWHRSGARWYRMRDHRGTWVLVERRHVPAVLIGVPPGKYKHHKVKAKVAKGPHGKAHGRGKHKWK